MHPLDGLRLKIRSAESKVKVLDEAMFSLWKKSPYRIVRAELNPKTGNQVYRVKTDRPPLFLDWGVSIGEVAHNLRSALDGLVYQLALLKTKTPTGDMQQQFPIFLVGRTKKSRRGRRSPPLIPHFWGNGRGDGLGMVSDLFPAHKARIELLQPYKRGRGGSKNPLYWLKEVNNVDKHRLVLPVAADWGGGPAVSGTGEPTWDAYPFKRLHGRVLKDGTKFGEAARDMHVDSQIYPIIVFGEGCEAVKGLPVTNSLRRIAEYVSEIVESFASEFSVIS